MRPSSTNSLRTPVIHLYHRVFLMKPWTASMEGVDVFFFKFPLWILRFIILQGILVGPNDLISHRKLRWLVWKLADWMEWTSGIKKHLLLHGKLVNCLYIKGFTAIQLFGSRRENFCLQTTVWFLWFLDWMCFNLILADTYRLSLKWEIGDHKKRAIDSILYIHIILSLCIGVSILLGKKVFYIIFVAHNLPRMFLVVPGGLDSGWYVSDTTSFGCKWWFTSSDDMYGPYGLYHNEYRT